MLLFVGRAEHLEEEPLTEWSTVLLLWRLSRLDKLEMLGSFSQQNQNSTSHARRRRNRNRTKKNLNGRLYSFIVDSVFSSLGGKYWSLFGR
jgi:5-methylcytosine-specific restriction endonuclease McrBC GTP-binding regulatory subunit McrB